MRYKYYSTCISFLEPKPLHARDGIEKWHSVVPAIATLLNDRLIRRELAIAPPNSPEAPKER